MGRGRGRGRGRSSRGIGKIVITFDRVVRSLLQPYLEIGNPIGQNKQPRFSNLTCLRFRIQNTSASSSRKDNLVECVVARRRSIRRKSTCATGNINIYMEG